MTIGPILRKYGTATTINFALHQSGGDDLQTAAVHVAGDSTIMKDEGVEGNTTNGFVDEGSGYSLALSAAEMQAARIMVFVVDQTGPKAWRDLVILVETYGHPSAQHRMDLDSNLAKQALVNKRTHTVSTGVDTIYEDDGVTVARTMTPTDDGDNTVTIMPS